MRLEELDVKDRKILLALDMDARAADSVIAKRVGLSKQVTNYRIKRLERQGIIQSYYPVIDHSKLGLQLYRVALKFENLSKQKEEELIAYLKTYVSWMVSTLGAWDLSFALYAKDEYEFVNFWNTFYERYGSTIQDRWISLMTTMRSYERMFLHANKQAARKIHVVGGKAESVNLDDIDIALLKELNRGSRQTSLELAKKLHTTERVARYRLKRLEERKIVLSYRPFLDTAALGLRYYKIYISLHNAKAEDFRKIQTLIHHEPNVVYQTEALGGYDFELEIQLSDSQRLFYFITNLKLRFPHIIKSISHLEYVKEHKVSYYPTSNQ